MLRADAGVAPVVTRYLKRQAKRLWGKNNPTDGESLVILERRIVMPRETREGGRGKCCATMTDAGAPFMLRRWAAGSTEYQY